MNKYNGLRKVTISSLIAGSTTRQSVTILGNMLGSDGLNVEADPIEQSIESFESTTVEPVGTELKAGTLYLIPYGLEDKGKMLPFGYDKTTNTWNMYAQGCNMSDVTIDFARVCQNSDGSNGVNFLFRHAELSLAHAVTIKRATTTPLELKFYPQFSPSTEYGITSSTNTQAWQEYYGVYDGSTDKVTYDVVKTS